jgi:error-prone DNA polymerase
MRIAMAAAEFTPEEANGLRRAMATFRNVGTMPKFQRRMVDRMIARGYDPVFANSCFDQIKGFGSYGFPESHAASFAQLVYVSSWIKHYHPDVFCCGLLNSQPMGFYAPAQIVGDARENGVDVREIDVSHSFGQNMLEEQSGARSHCAVRLGFRQIDGFEVYDPDGEQLENSKPVELRSKKKARKDYWDQRIIVARAQTFFVAGRFCSRDGIAETGVDFTRRCRCIPLARARPPRSAVDGAALTDDVPLPLFESTAAREQPDEAAQPLPLMPLPEQVVADYQTIRLSLKGHPMEFLRTAFARDGIIACRRYPTPTTRGRCAAPVWCWCVSAPAVPRVSCS